MAARKPIIGAEPIAAFLLKIARTPVPQMRVDIDSLNGGPGVLIHTKGRLELTMAIAVNDQRKITGVYLVRNPDKLIQLPGQYAPAAESTLAEDCHPHKIWKGQ